MLHLCVLLLPHTHQFFFAEEEKGGLQLVLLRLGHGQVFESGLRDGHVQALGQLAHLAGRDAVVEREAETEHKMKY